MDLLLLEWKCCLHANSYNVQEVFVGFIVF